MRRVLLVDDELLVITTLKANINWDKCGVDDVVLCDNTADAKKIIAANQVDLIVSDIEMPGEDGIAFISWLRGQNIDTPVIFLTGYAEFEYAKAAVKLRVEEYVLKPVDYAELEEKIIDCIKKKELQDREKLLQQQYVLHKGELFGECIRYVLNSDEEIEGKALLAMFERFHLDFTSEAGYVLIWLKLPSGKKSGWSQLKRLQEAFKSGMESDMVNFYSSRASEDRLVICLKAADPTRLDPEQLREQAAAIVSAVDARCCCFLSEPFSVEWFVPMARKMADRASGNVIYQNQVVMVGRQNVEAPQSRIEVNYKKWMLLAENHSFDELQSDVEFTLHQIVAVGGMNAEMLRDVYNNFVQAMYHFIGEKYSARAGIVQGKELAALQNSALNSVKDFQKFESCFIERVKEHLRDQDSNTSVAAALRYIDEHLAEKLNRADIAAHVALHENYLSRLFHAEMGCSISDYILQKRMELAKELLRQTTLSVSEIGLRCGYDTTTYFIQIFKREAGKTPKEYRKDMKL